MAHTLETAGERMSTGRLRVGDKSKTEETTCGLVSGYPYVLSQRQLAQRGKTYGKVQNMTQREIDIDDELLARAMEALGTRSVDETVNAVLRMAAELDRKPE